MPNTKFPESYRNADAKTKNLYKPLKITHGGGYDVKNPDFDEKCRQIEKHIDKLAKIGYGGIVTNVQFTKEYIKDETMLKLLKHEVEYCKKTGMRVWLYDEKGYPSGTAGGLTLEKNPDFEAKGLVGVFKTVKPSETVSIEFPRGHEKVVAAYAYNGTCFDDIDTNSAVSLTTEKNSDLKYTNDSESPRFVAYLASKRMYEGTHAQHNCCESRRYIDVMNKDAVKEFIANTYEVYKNTLGEYFGNGIEAMFTDEPSLMAHYLNVGLDPRDIHDEYDNEIPLLPVVNWTNEFLSRFKNLFGYDIEKYLPFMFGGNTQKACEIREDYHNAVSKFYEESFLCQIQDFCEKNNIAFSGHLLYEEAVSVHPAFEGNFFHQIKHMKYPGIDILTTLAPNLMNNSAQVPKLVASVAALNGREHVMSEVSSHIEGGKQTPAQMLSSCVLQYALGVDIFTSYYSEKVEDGSLWDQNAGLDNFTAYFEETVVDERNYRIWNETLGRIAALMNGGTHKAKILLYYPIETANRNYLPQYDCNKDEKYQISPNYDLSFSKKNWAANDSWTELSRSLLKNQLDYFMTDFETLQRFKISDSGGKINISESKNDFEVLILPACDINDKLLNCLKNLGENGVKIMTVMKPEFSAEVKKAASVKNLKVCKDEKDLTMNLIAAINPDVFLKKEAEIIYLKKENANGVNYLFVNAQESSVKTTVELYLDKKCAFSLYNPLTDEKTPLDVEINGNKAAFDLQLPQHGFIVVMTE